MLYYLLISNRPKHLSAQTHNHTFEVLSPGHLGFVSSLLPVLFGLALTGALSILLQ